MIYFWENFDQNTASIVCDDCGKAIEVKVGDMMKGKWRRADGVWFFVRQFGRNILKWRVVVTIFHKG
jgi:hypothetical protein